MRTLRRPSRDALAAFAESQAGVPFSYPEVGASAGEVMPHGYTVDRYGVVLGHGAATYERAAAALRAWRQCDLGWVTVVPAAGPLRIGQDLAVHVHVPPTHFLNGARVTVLQEADTPARRSLRVGYGTLATHAERGEETFAVAWDKATGEVRYDVVAFSRPALLSARLLKPVTRALQRRFARHSMAAMQRACA